MIAINSVLSHVRKHWRRYSILLAFLLVYGVAFKVARMFEDAVIRSHESKAEKAEDKALNAEGKADAHRDQADELEKQRQEAKRRVEDAKRRAAVAKARLAEKKKGLEDAKNNNPVDACVGTLDERERCLQSKLDWLYPD